MPNLIYIRFHEKNATGIKCPLYRQTDHMPVSRSVQMLSWPVILDASSAEQQARSPRPALQGRLLQTETHDRAQYIDLILLASGFCIKFPSICQFVIVVLL